jgi:plastocyanin
MRALPILVLVSVVALAPACGSSKKISHKPAAPGRLATKTFQLKADAGGQLKFDLDHINTTVGQIQLVMTNASSLRHDVAIRGHGVHEVGKIVGKGGRSVVTATLRVGTYEFYCSVDAHEQAGMKGTIEVGQPGSVS